MSDLTVHGYAVVDGDGTILINTVAQTQKTAMILWLRVYGRMRLSEEDSDEGVAQWFAHQRGTCIVQPVRIEITHPKVN